MNDIPRSRFAAVGFAGGILNGLFGAGGGSVTVPLLEHSGLEPKKSHTMSVAVMFFISMISSAGNIFLGNVPWEELKYLVPAGMVGAVVGTLILRKADNDVLRRIFGALMIYSGGRMLLQ